jgi:hypothetical protein
MDPSLLTMMFNTADVTAVVPLMRCHELAPYYVDRMTKAWVPLALTEVGLLDSLFLAACRHLYGNCQQPEQKQRFVKLAAHYKLACARSLRKAISAEAFFSDATIAKSLMLAYDEVSRPRSRLMG